MIVTDAVTVFVPREAIDSIVLNSYSVLALEGKEVKLIDLLVRCNYVKVKGCWYASTGILYKDLILIRTYELSEGMIENKVFSEGHVEVIRDFTKEIENTEE